MNGRRRRRCRRCRRRRRAIELLQLRSRESFIGADVVAMVCVCGVVV